MHVYIVDTGIIKTHTEFAGRVGPGYDVWSDGEQEPLDCYGHGTHCAGVAVGSTVGVARSATVHAVRVIDCCSSRFVTNMTRSCSDSRSGELVH